MFQKEIFRYVLPYQLSFEDLKMIEETRKIELSSIEIAWEVIFKRDFPKAYKNCKENERYVFEKLDSISRNPRRKYYKRYYEFMVRATPFEPEVIKINLTSPISRIYRAEEVDFVLTTEGSDFCYFISFKNYPKCITGGENEYNLIKELNLGDVILSNDYFFELIVHNRRSIDILSFLSKNEKNLLISNKSLGNF